MPPLPTGTTQDVQKPKCKPMPLQGCPAIQTPAHRPTAPTPMGAQVSPQCAKSARPLWQTATLKHDLHPPPMPHHLSGVHPPAPRLVTAPLLRGWHHRTHGPDQSPRNPIAEWFPKASDGSHQKSDCPWQLARCPRLHPPWITRQHAAAFAQKPVKRLWRPTRPNLARATHALPERWVLLQQRLRRLHACLLPVSTQCEMQSCRFQCYNLLPTPRYQRRLAPAPLSEYATPSPQEPHLQTPHPQRIVQQLGATHKPRLTAIHQRQIQTHPRPN